MNIQTETGGGNEGKIRHRPYIAVNQKEKIKLIPLEDIYYFKAENRSIVIHTLDEQYFITGTLNSLETELDESFLRIHRNALISNRYLDSLQRNSDGDWYIIFSDIKDKLKISRRKIPHIRRWLKSGTVHPH